MALAFSEFLVRYIVSLYCNFSENFCPQEEINFNLKILLNAHVYRHVYRYAYIFNLYTRRHVHA